MAYDPEEMMARFDEVMGRFPLTQSLTRGSREATLRRARRKAERAGRKAKRMAMLVAGVVVLTLFYGIAIGPIGIGALMSIVLLTIIACILLGVFPRDVAAPPAKLAVARPALLPSQVESWLDAKRRALPALAAPKVDAISAQLAALQPQLATVPAGDPTALELNRLLGKHLPELVASYEKVPAAQRKASTVPGGPTIERQLVDGLGLIETELARVNDRLGAADRDNFLVQGKFLENRYGKDGSLTP